MVVEAEVAVDVAGEVVLLVDEAVAAGIAAMAVAVMGPDTATAVGFFHV